MKNFLLIINSNEHTKSWGRISNELWQKIIDVFISKEINRIGFECVIKASDIACIENFENWESAYLENYRVTMTWKNKLGKTLQAQENLAIFDFTEEWLQDFREIPFDWWNQTSETHPVEKIYCFKDQSLILRTNTLESTILFWLDYEQQKLLESIDKEVSTNLPERNIKIRIEKNDGLGK